MDYFVAVITLLVLAFLYWRMIRREMPRPVSPFQAILPFALGIVSMLIYGPCLIGFIRQFSHMSVYLSEAPPVLQGMLKAFLMAGFPEEMLKMIFILIALVAANEPLARQHLIVFLHVADEREISTCERQFFHLQGLLSFVADDQCLALRLSRELAIRR